MPTSLELEKQFQNQLKNQKSSQQIRQEEETRVGLPDRRRALNNITKNILDTSRVLKNVDHDVAARARRLGGPVTEAARRRLTSAVQAPIQSRLIDMGEQQAREQVGIGDLENEVAQMLGLRVKDQITANNLFLSKIDRQMARESQELADKRAAEQLALQKMQMEADNAYRQRALSLQERQGNVGNDLKAWLDEYMKRFNQEDDIVIDTGGDNTQLVSNAGVDAGLARRGSEIYDIMNNGKETDMYKHMFSNTPYYIYKGATNAPGAAVDNIKKAWSSISSKFK